MLNCSVPNGSAHDGFALDKGNDVAGQEVVAGGSWLGGQDWVFQPDAAAEFQVVILPGELSILLLSASGSTNFLADNVSKMSDVSSALG